MEKHILPAIGTSKAHRLTTDEVVGAVLPTWTATPVTGLRLLQRIHAVLEQAIAGDPANFPHGNVADRARALLPRGVRAKPVPHPSFVWQAAPEFYGLLCGRPEAAAMALRLCMLTGTPRSAEVVAARWGEIEQRWGIDVWRVPGSRVKARQIEKPMCGRVIPLSSHAMKLLAEIRPADFKPEDFIFPCRGTGRVIKGERQTFAGHIGEKQMQRLVRETMQLGWHVHGVRSAFTGWAATHAQTPAEMLARKIALDHRAADDATDAAYMRETLPAAHRALLQRWGTFLTV